jgi:hypothetical protein
MPGGDGTGPMGMGPMTGRATGYCARTSVPSYTNSIPGRGFGMGFGHGFGGRGRGGGWGRRNWSYSTGMPGWARAVTGIPTSGDNPPDSGAPTAEQELDVLKSQAEYFGGALENIKKRIIDLEANTKTD